MRAAAHLHLSAIALALLGAIVEGSLEAPPPPFPRFERLTLAPGRPLPHPRHPQARLHRGALSTPPGGREPISIRCWVAQGQLVELGLPGQGPVSAPELAAALDWYLERSQEAPPLGPWPFATQLDLDYVWAELGLLYELADVSELRLIAVTVLGAHLDAEHRRDLGVQSPAEVVPLLVLRLREAHSDELHFALLSPDGRWICRRALADFAGCQLSLQEDVVSGAYAPWGLAPPADAGPSAPSPAPR